MKKNQHGLRTEHGFGNRILNPCSVLNPCWLILLFLLLLARAAGARPNVIVILADDMGFSDIGCYGGEIDTPNIDRLAANGLRFTQFYNTARCCPTRASLLTGLYPHQAGVPHMVDNTRLPIEQRQLSRHTRTIAEVLRTNGYRTAMSGKWHVCPVTNYLNNGPLARGFDHFYGIIHGGASYYTPVTLMRDQETITNVPPNYFLTDAIAENAAAYIRDFAPNQNPFFVYVAFTAPHWPLHAPDQDVHKYLGRYRPGWDELRKARHQRQLDMGIVEPRWPISPRDPDARAWQSVTNKDWQVHRMAVYAAQVERMDRGIGSILNALRDTRTLDNTLIFFLSDNGGCAEVLGANNKALHVPLRAPNGGPMRLGNSPDILPGSGDTYASYGLPWANLSNTPFRSYKHWVHEGGIASPLIVHWPARIPKAGIRSDPSHLIDIMATSLDVARANHTAPVEGKSLAPVFAGRKLRERPIFFEHEANRAVRLGDWKLVSRYPGDWELYNMALDRTELNNLAAQEPKHVAKLAREYDRWAKRVNVPAPELVAPSNVRR